MTPHSVVFLLKYLAFPVSSFCVTFVLAVHQFCRSLAHLGSGPQTSLTLLHTSPLLSGMICVLTQLCISPAAPQLGPYSVCCIFHLSPNWPPQLPPPTSPFSFPLPVVQSTASVMHQICGKTLRMPQHRETQRHLSECNS